MLSRFKPEDFAIDRDYFETFDNMETEVSAKWVVRFLQDRGKGWTPFRVAEIEEFYADKFERDVARFSFNRLTTDEHTHVSARGNYPMAHDRAIEICDEVCHILEAFVIGLVKGGLHHIEKGEKTSRPDWADAV